MIRIFFASFTLLVLNTLNAVAQGERQYSGLFDTYYYRGPFSVTGGAGMTLYNGNMSSKPGYAVSIGANYKVWPRIVFGGEIMFNQLGGSKVTDSTKFSFTSSNIELDLYGRFYIVDDIVRISRDRTKQPTLLKPYITTGINFLRYQPTSTYVVNGQTIPASEGITKAGYTPCVPLGLGLQIGVSPRLSVLAEVSYRYIFTDFVDYTSNRSSTGFANSYVLVGAKVQYSPFIPRKKKPKKSGGTPPAQYDGPKGTETWKNRKKEEPVRNEEYTLPGEEQPNQENPDQNQDQNQEQNQDQNQNEGGDNQQEQNQNEQTPSK